MSREQILNRVRQAVRAGRAHHVRVRDDLPGDVGYLGGGDDPLERMACEVDEVGGQAHVVDDEVAARAVLEQLLRQYQARNALCWRHPLLERVGVARALEAVGVRRWDYRALGELDEDERRATILAADVGITSAAWAIAETGTLAMAAMPGSERVASLLPPVHVAVIERSQILPDLLDWFARLELSYRDTQRADSAHPLPSNLTLITGPSKTADIELQLTTGVHGPGSWHVILLR